ncbi:hypothetical protein [Rhizobium leguminosarum]|uniref:hypothetical protein n=1 Tax=Rhizobium leguminosarum TaxID=384 RepID=UPI001C94135F|nr:hypothetical protein [Rhizobium leguminosarum]
MKSITEWNDKQLGNLIANYQRLGKVEEAYYLDALSEIAPRKGAGLNLDKTFNAVLKAAKKRRFLSYKQLSEARCSANPPWPGLSIAESRCW